MSARLRIRAATPADFELWGPLRMALWPDESCVGDPEQMRAWIASTDRIALLAFDSAHVETDDLNADHVDAGDVRISVIGFAELALRHDYVNGTESSPVGFLEGWYVAPDRRGQGVGRALVAAGEDWARARGCGEFASDALLDNVASHAAHMACGFEETERVVYFRKPLLP